MRITNKMMTNSSMSNINKNKYNLSKLESQYSTNKKIQRPSEDPIVAVRALRLRKNLDELNQYYERNIPDAMSWMDSTEGALTNINSILTNIYQQFNQGSNDPLSVTDRTSIVENLKQYKNQIYQEGNTNYAGRYVFTGYKTNTSLIFNESTKNLSYAIKENFSGKDITATNVVVGDYDLKDYDPENPTNTKFDQSPKMEEVYRIRLSYDNLKVNKDDNTISYYIDGVEHKADITSVTADNAYQVTGNAQFIPETGELIFSKDQYQEFSKAEEISITYKKEEFNQYDLRPEHYFECEVTDLDDPTKDPLVYKNENQEIQYEVNFGQKLTVNTQGKDALTHTIGREIDEIVSIVNKVSSIEAEIADVEKQLQEKNITEEQKAALTDLKSALEKELTLQSKVMQEKFSKGMTTTSSVQDKVNTAVADLGARYVRLELVESRLSNQQVEFEDLMSKNEDADMVETIVKYNSQETIYNASLSVASKIVKNTLLDFL